MDYWYVTGDAIDFPLYTTHQRSLAITKSLVGVLNSDSTIWR